MDMQQEITIPGTKKKIPLKIILLGGAAILILYFVTRNKSGSTSGSSTDGLLAEEYNQRLQDQYDSLSGIVQNGAGQPDQITAPIDTAPGGLPLAYMETSNYPEYASAPGIIAQPYLGSPPVAPPQPTTVGRSMSGQVNTAPSKTRIQMEQQGFTFSATPPTTRPVTTITSLTAQGMTRREESQQIGDTPPVAVGRAMTNQVASAPIDRLPGRSVTPSTPVNNVARAPIPRESTSVVNNAPRAVVTSTGRNVPARVAAPQPIAPHPATVVTATTRTTLRRR
jgi:hypothetical protein